MSTKDEKQNIAIDKSSKIIKFFNFTRESILTVGILYICLTVWLATNTDFSNVLELKKFIYIVISIFVLYIIYTSSVLVVYYSLPKNKNKKLGVLFVVDTHGQHADYIAIKEKFLENFVELEEKVAHNVLHAIILSEKKTSVRRRCFSSDKYQKEILEKTNCSFGIFVKVTSVGRTSSTYELKFNAKYISNLCINDKNFDILYKNLNTILNTITPEIVDRNNELYCLQNLGEKFFIICQYICGIAHAFSHDYFKAINIFNELVKVASKKDKFQAGISLAAHANIFIYSWARIDQEYNTYTTSGRYDCALISKVLHIVEPSIKALDSTNNMKIKTILPSNKDDIVYSAKAIIAVLENNLSLAQEIIDRYKKITKDRRALEYSAAFVFSCRNDRKKI